MAEVNHIKVGNTTYDLGPEAAKLAPGATIDGVTFTGEYDIKHYGVCATAADTAAKTVYVDGFVLSQGARVAVKFTNLNTADAPTLNVSSTGAVPIKAYGEWGNGDVAEFVYDGTNWASVSGDAGRNVVKNSGALDGAAPISSYQATPGMLNSANTWTGVTSTTYTHIAVPISGGETIEVAANSLINCIVAFVRSYTPPTANGQTPDYSTQSGYTGRVVVSLGALQTYTAPSDAAYMLVGLLFAGNDISPSVLRIGGYDVAKTVADNIADISENIGSINATYPDVLHALSWGSSTISGTVETDIVYNNTYRSGSALAGYNTYSFPVTAGAVYALTATIPSGAAYRPALFYGADNQYVGQIAKDGETYTDFSFTVPAGAALMRVSASAGANAPALEQEGVYPKPITDKLNSVTVTANGATIHMDRYSITMQKHGLNNLMDLYKIFKADGTLIYTGSSDWQGPYVVDAINNADGDAISAGRDYTGGNHPYGPGADGTATGATLSFAVYADGSAVAPGSSDEWVDCVVVEWENEIQAWNTKIVDGSGRPVLHERPRWIFRRDGTVEVQNTIIALEDILIYNYYGIQMQAAWLSSGFFLPSVSREVQTVADLNALCGGYAEGTETTGYNGDIQISIGYDPLSDLGTGAGLNGWTAGRLHMSTTKFYTKMCNNFSLNAGETAQYRGFYLFKVPGDLSPVE